MIELWSSSNPKELVPGDVAGVRAAADLLLNMERSYTELYDAIKRTQNSQSLTWEGDASNAARDVLDEFVKPWETAGIAHQSTKDALRAYADALAAAQGDAAVAVAEYKRGNSKTRAAQESYKRQDPLTRGPFVDPGESIRRSAETHLANARARLEAAAEDAAVAIDAAADSAPDGPGFWGNLLGDLGDIAELFSLTGGGGVVVSALIDGQEGDDKRDFLERIFHRVQENWVYDLFSADDTNLDFDDFLWSQDLQGTTEFRDQTARGAVASANDGLTAGALAIGGLLTGGSAEPPRYDPRSDLWIVTMPDGFTKAMQSVGSGGFTVGNVFFARGDTNSEDPALLMHEWKHSRQYSLTGGASGFLSRYFTYHAIAGTDPTTDATNNPFEQSAGLRDGGYVRRDSVADVSFPDPFATLSELRRR
jgi:hypothetical protein